MGHKNDTQTLHLVTNKNTENKNSDFQTIENDSPALAAYMRNLDAISKKIDSESSASPQAILPAEAERQSLSLKDQTSETIEMLRREAADHIALHIALEEHLMEQMAATQQTLRGTVNAYLEVIKQLNELEDDHTSAQEFDHLTTDLSFQGDKTCH